MIPNSNLITIKNNISLLEEFIFDLFISPRKLAHKWSNITHQTPNIKLGYPAQHLASLILGMKGNATGARGDDIVDGTEVKACNRIDQVDTCKKCKENVLRTESKCSICGSVEIRRNNDSKWLFTIKNEDDLSLFRTAIPRVLLILSDYPNFKNNDFNSIRIQSFEIWINSPRQKRFIKLLENYYNNIYLEQKKLNPRKTPAPKNFWPYSYQFYVCNPIKTFDCLISNFNIDKPQISISYYVNPSDNRSNIKSELMPKSLLDCKEITELENIFGDLNKISSVDETMGNYLTLRPDRFSENKTKYSRRD